MPLGEAPATAVKYRVVDCLHRRAVSGQEQTFNLHYYAIMKSQIITFASSQAQAWEFNYGSSSFPSHEA